MTDDERDLETIRRRPARSGRVDYGDPVVLHDTSKRRLVVVPFFITHSDHTELAIPRKISFLRKRRDLSG